MAVTLEKLTNTNSDAIFSKLTNTNSKMLLFNPRLTDDDWSVHELPPMCVDKGRYGKYRWSQFSNPFDNENYHELTTQLLQSTDIPDTVDECPVYIMGVKYKHLPEKLWGDGNDVQIGYTGTSEIIDFPDPKINIPNDYEKLEQLYCNDIPLISTKTFIRECQEEMSFTPNIDNVAWIHAPNNLCKIKNKKWIAGTVSINNCKPVKYSNHINREIIKNNQRKYLKCAGIIWGNLKELVNAIIMQFGIYNKTYNSEYRTSFGNVLDGDNIEGIVLLPKKETLNELNKSLKLCKNLQKVSNMTIQCKDCNEMFEFSIKQQQYFLKNMWANPIRCKNCRINNKREKTINK